MKKIAYLFLVFLIALAMASCNDSVAVDDDTSSSEEDAPVSDVSGLRFESNVDAIAKKEAKAKTLERIGEPIVGVLLKFDGAQAYGYDENVCYLHYLGDGVTEYNGDGMPYNYILYSPAMIYEVYNKAGGLNGYNSGNPFWWYMSQYFGLDINTILTDWYPILETLLNQTELPEPKVEDVGQDWKGAPPTLPDIEIPEFDPETEIIVLSEVKGPVTEALVGYPYRDRMSFSPYAKLGGYDDVVSNAFYISGDCVVYYPMKIYEAYNKSGDSLFIYMEAHYGITKEQVEEEGMQLVINKLLEAYADGPLPLPSAADWAGLAIPGFDVDTLEDNRLYIVDGRKDESVSPFVLDPYTDGPFHNAAGYEKAEDCCFYISEEGRVYMPKALSDAYAEYKGVVDDKTGNPFWAYMNTYFAGSDYRGSVQKAMELLLAEDTLPYPDSSDYRM